MCECVRLLGNECDVFRLINCLAGFNVQMNLICQKHVHNMPWNLATVSLLSIQIVREYEHCWVDKELTLDAIWWDMWYGAFHMLCEWTGLTWINGQVFLTRQFWWG